MYISVIVCDCISENCGLYEPKNEYVNISMNIDLKYTIWEHLMEISGVPWTTNFPISADWSYLSPDITIVHTVDFSFVYIIYVACKSPMIYMLFAI